MDGEGLKMTSREELVSKFEGERVAMEGEELNMTLLPEELVERIVAMVPFPNIFKARALSRSWLARLSSVSSQDDLEAKRLAVSFQKRVGEYSTNWKTFCPVILANKYDLRAFHRESDRWIRVPSLSFPFRDQPRINLMHIEGALVLFVSRSTRYSWPREMFVANVLSRCWKWLPSPPSTDKGHGSQVTLVSHKDTYKVIEFLHDRGGLPYALIYDSKLGAWSKKVEVPKDFSYLDCHRVYLNGVLYWLNSHDLERRCNLLAFNVEKETFDVLEMSKPPVPEFYFDVYLVVCDGRLLMTVSDSNDSVSVMKMDVDMDPRSNRWLKVTQGPPAALNFGTFSRSTMSDGHSIFFLGLTPDKSQVTNKLLAYNVKKDEWSSFPMSTTEHFSCSYVVDYFQPGLNPFMAL